MFFESCKIKIRDQIEYMVVATHFTDVLYGGSLGCVIDKFPIYVFISDTMDINYGYIGTVFNDHDFVNVNISKFLSFKYIISKHFRNRFSERFKDVTYSRLKNLLKKMIRLGTHLKRRDSVKLLKYHTTSDYILYFEHDGNEKRYYMLVLTNKNVFTTIYEFEDIKDIKYFKEV